MKMKRTVTKKAKSLLTLLLAILMMASLMAGCATGGDKDGTETDSAVSNSGGTSDSGGTGDVIELTFWTLSTRQEVYDAITADFNASQDAIHVTVSYYDTDGIKDSCKVAAASNTLPSMWFNWGGSLGQYYVDNGCTYDLTDYAAANNWTDKFNSTALSLCTLGGELSGYPTNVCVMGVFYSKAIFEQYNIQVPTTFAELEQVCATLKENGVTPFSTAGLYGWHVMRILEQFVEYYAGTDLHDTLQTMTTSWEDATVVEALTKFQEWCDNGYFPDGFLTNDPNDTFLALATGSCAMDLQGQWYDGVIVSNEQDVNDYDWFAFPNDTGRMSAFAEQTQLNANLTDEQLEACITYLDYMFTDDNVQKYAGKMDPVSATVDFTISDETPHVSQMYDYANEHGTFTITDQAFPTEVADVLFSNQDALYSGTTTPAEAAAAIQAAIESFQASK